MSIPEDTPLNSFVIMVKADDPDEGANGIVTYRFNDTLERRFLIDENSGTITTNTLFDYEYGLRSYSLDVCGV